MEALKKAIDAFANAFRVEDLRKKLLFTLGVLIIYRIGSHISIPGVDPPAWQVFSRKAQIISLVSTIASQAAPLQKQPYSLLA